MRFSAPLNLSVRDADILPPYCRSRHSAPCTVPRPSTPKWTSRRMVGAVLAATRLLAPVDMIKLTETREITPYVWVHPDEER